MTIGGPPELPDRLRIRVVFRRLRAIRPRHRAVAAGVAFIVLGWACAFVPDVCARYSGYQWLNSRALGLTQDALDRNLKSFLTVSGIKAVVALLEGSSVGVGFELEVGDLVQPAYDYIDFVWKLLLYALLILGFYQLLLETGVLTVGVQILGLGLMFWGVAMIYPTPHLDTRAWARRIVLLGVLLAFVVPVALLATDFVSNRYMDPLKAKYSRRLEETQDKLAVHRAAIYALKDDISIKSPVESINAVRAQATVVLRNVTDTVWESLQVMLFYVIILMLELLIFPLVSAYVLYKFFHFAMGRVITATVLVPPAAPAPESPAA